MEQSDRNCCAKGASPASDRQKLSLDADWLDGQVESGAGPIPRLRTRLGWSDILGNTMVRCNIRRMNYSIPPGLYAVGTPTCGSPVLVTANYKLTVDHLRKQIEGLSVWVLVLDTKGVNVWCAAGKGTFSTEEILRCLEEYHVADATCMRLLILPQLGAPGVSAHTVKTQSGFLVKYGPVLASDLPPVILEGAPVTPGMRRVNFGWRDRVAVMPIELIQSIKPTLGMMLLFGVVLWIVSLFSGVTDVRLPVASVKWFALTWIMTGVFMAVCMPILPGRAFSIKGAWIGVGVSIAASGLGIAVWGSLPETLYSIGMTSATIAWAAFLALQYTGTSTFTSQTGVKRELRTAVPLQIIFIAIGLILSGIGMAVT
jgi:hypothetical protein